MLPEGVRRLFRLATRRAAVKREISDEIRFHLEQRVAELEATGLSATAALRHALDEYGDVNASRAELASVSERRDRHRRASEWWRDVAQDLRYGMRGLRRSPGFTVVLLGTLSLGIGANTAVFSVVNSLVLNPISYRDANRVHLIWRTQEGMDVRFSPSDSMVTAWQRDARLFDGIEPYDIGKHTLTGHGEPLALNRGSVSATFPAFAGVHMLRGRAFLPSEVVKGAPDVVILGEHTWKRVFGSAEDIVGQTIRLDGKPYSVIGVATDRWRVPSISQALTDIWTPLVAGDNGSIGLVMGRLKEGVSQIAAEEELTRVAERNSQPTVTPQFKAPLKLQRLGDSIWFRESLMALVGAVGLLLFIACANVAHLLLARGAARERELAIRRALGASRMRIARQLLAESALVAVGGCVLGILTGFVGLRALVALRPPRLDALVVATLDHNVLAFTVGISLITGIGFGLLGALSAARGGSASSLKTTAIAGSTSRVRSRVRSGLVITEMALTAMLLVGATLLIRSVLKLQSVDPGFDTRNLYAARFQLPAARHANAASWDHFANTLIETTQRIGGVAIATTAGCVPPDNCGVMFGQWEIDDGTLPASAKGIVFANHVRPDFSAVLGVAIRAGRGFDAGSASRKEVIISDGMARRLYADGQAIGRRFRTKTSPGRKPADWMTVVGVVSQIAVTGLARPSDQALVLFPSVAGADWNNLTLAFRVRDGANPIAAVRKALMAADSTLPQPTIVKVDDALLQSIASQRFMMSLLVAFASLAALLSAIGLYGVISYMVSQRTREIGIRIALGGQRGHITRLVVGGGAAMCLVGLGIGLVAATWTTKIVQSLLFQVKPNDLLSFAAGGAMLMVVGALACFAPVLRALRVDPVTAIRSD